MRTRLFIIAIRNDISETFNIDVSSFLDFEKHSTPSLAEYMGKSFEKKIAYTIRCGGRKSPLNDKHNWDGYLVDKKEYRLSIEDCLKLQGFENFELEGTSTQKYKMLGNTIPTNLTYLIGKKIVESIDI
jgi:DNA (cytosine-5)-methyltransferase 1